jgi:K+-sensing histidine kinase KdpD
MPKSSPGGSEQQDVAWPDIVKFVRQLSHDIRNNLNAVELQSAFLAELAEESEIKNEVQRLRQMVSQIGTNLQRLTAGLAQSTPNPIPYRAADFVEDLRRKIGKEFAENSGKISWEVQLKDEMLNIDPQLAQQAALELFSNAFQHEPNAKSIAARAYIENDSFALELRETKSKFPGSTENWGREPLRNMSQGHYGLGLNRVRMIAEAHGGELRAEYDRKTSILVSKLSLPIDREAAR